MLDGIKANVEALAEATVTKNQVVVQQEQAPLVEVQATCGHPLDPREARAVS